MEILRRSQQTSQRHFKPLADWDWNWPTAFERPDLERNLTLDFLTRGETVILGAQERGVDWQDRRCAPQAQVRLSENIM